CKGWVLDGYLEIFTKHVGQLCLQDELFVVVLKDVNRWQPRAGRHQRLVSARAWMNVGIAEHATDAILKVREFPKWIQTNDSHDFSSTICVIWLQPEPKPGWQRSVSSMFPRTLRRRLLPLSHPSFASCGHPEPDRSDHPGRPDRCDTTAPPARARHAGADPRQSESPSGLRPVPLDVPRQRPIRFETHRPPEPDRGFRGSFFRPHTRGGK